VLVLVLELLAQNKEFGLDLRGGNLLFEFSLQLLMGCLNLLVEGVVQD